MNKPLHPLMRQNEGITECMERQAAEIERLRAIEKAARVYYNNYCQDEANEEGVCGRGQQIAAMALRDALAGGVTDQDEEKRCIHGTLETQVCGKCCGYE